MNQVRPVPKPPKRKRKTKRLSPAKYRQLCEQVARRAGNRCERCKPSKGTAVSDVSQAREGYLSIT